MIDNGPPGCDEGQFKPSRGETPSVIDSSSSYRARRRLCSQDGSVQEAVHSVSTVKLPPHDRLSPQ